MATPVYSTVQVTATKLPDGRYQAKIVASPANLQEPAQNHALPKTFASEAEALSAGQAYADENYPKS